MIDKVFNISFISVTSFIFFLVVFSLIFFTLNKKANVIKEDENELFSILGSVLFITCFLSGISYTLLLITKSFLK